MKGLSEAMKKALLSPDEYHDPNTIRALRRKGLWSFITVGPTPEGLAVRNHLEQHHGE